MAKTARSVILLILLLSFSSCEERTGFLDKDQKEIVSMLTDTEWLMEWGDYGSFGETQFESDTDMYKFDQSGTGWFAFGSWTDPDKKDGVGYFHWTFTNDNFSVICMVGAIESYWLIEKLTPDELLVTSAPRDPVLYPSQDRRRYRFKSRKN